MKKTSCYTIPLKHVTSKTIPSFIKMAALILFLAGIALPVSASPIYFYEDFDDDFIEERNVPDSINAGLSTPFSIINENRPAASGFLTLRDRDISGGGEGGGFTPLRDVALDFTDGRGSFLTFSYYAGGQIIGPDSFITFDIVRYGSDAGSLYKYISSDGINFSQTGDGSDNLGHYSFNLASGTTETFFKLQVGTAAGIWEGVHVDHFAATINPIAHPQVPEPSTLALFGSLFAGIGFMRRKFGK